MFTLKRALMNPIPTLAAALKWVASTTSIVSTPGPHWPDLVRIGDEGPDLLAAGLDRNGALELHAALQRVGSGRGQSVDDTDAGT